MYVMEFPISHTSDPIFKEIHIILYHVNVEKWKDYLVSNLHKCKKILHPHEDTLRQS